MSELRYISVDDDVFLAAQSLQKKEDQLGLTAFMLAEREILKCQELGDTSQATFWKAVWDFEMTLNCVSAGTLILINTAKC